MPDATAVQRLTKRTLVTVSHALEQAALASAEDGPMVVFALFQRPPYFERERQVYERIASRATATVIGLVAGQAPDMPAGAYPVLLEEKEELAREWTVVVLTPRFGAALVAHDLEQFQADAATLESGRVFEGRSCLRRDDALHEVLRLRHQLADRLSPVALSAVDAVIDRVRELPATPGESRADAVLHLFEERAEQDHARLRAAARRTGTAAQQVAGDTDLVGEPGVRRWAGANGVTSSGVLPVAVLAIRITHPATAGQDGSIGRTATRQQQVAIELLVKRLRPGDRASKVGQNDFVLFLPTMTHDDAVAFAYQLVADFAAADERSSFLSATVTVALTVTRRRPLPQDELWQALEWAINRQAPVVTIDG